MLKFNRIKGSDKLAEQFGMNEKTVEQTAELWKETFDEIDRVVEQQINVDPEAEGVEFDATVVMEAFFKKFNTQELQDIALMQFLIQDANRRAKSAIAGAMRERFGKMMEELAKAAEAEDDFDEDLL